ncbi:MAG: response regulator [Gemmatimonadetes bacterium]|nr:response regulator [Gemmatimonadota bacterium]
MLASLIPLAAEAMRDAGPLGPRTASSFGAVVLVLLALVRQRLARREIDELVASRIGLQQQLWQSQKLEAVGRLAGGIAHDFNNILAGISGHAQLLRTGVATDVSGEARQIEHSTQRAATIVKRLLTFSRSQSPVLRPVELTPAVRSMQPMLRQLVVSDTTLHWELNDDGAVVSLADGQLEQVLLNLAINARDASPIASTITVATRRVSVTPESTLHARGVPTGSWALLQVRDEGSGMDAATQSQIFEPFFTTKEGAGGTGLGLSTVAGIVSSSGGHIVVDSAPQAGTSMSILFPLADTGAVHAPALPEPPQVDGAARAVLIVDDEAPIRTALARYLDRVGFRALPAADATEAVEIMEREQWAVALVLTDVRMPGRTGLELAQELRARAPRIPILFMSGYAESPGAPGRVPPLEDTIWKPFDLVEVAALIRKRIEVAASAKRD